MRTATASRVVSLGNQHTDLGNPQAYATSPDYPASTEHEPARTIDNATCLSLPVEGPFAIGVSAFGPSLQKAGYSNYGTRRSRCRRRAAGSVTSSAPRSSGRTRT
jgi:hypothetical protein